MSSATAATARSDDTVRHHLRLFRGFRWWLRLVPSWPVADLAIYWIGRRGGFDPAESNVEAAAARLRDRPVLFVANSDDRRMPKEIAFDLKAAAGPQAEVLIVPGKSHGGAWRDGTAAYEAAAAVVLQPREAAPPHPWRRSERPSEPADEASPVSDEKPHHHQPFPEDEEGEPRPQPTSYTMVEPRFRERYFQFYKETYKPSVLDRKTKELVAIGASLAAKCQGCLEGHVKKALKFGASREEISEASRSRSASTPRRSST